MYENKQFLALDRIKVFEMVFSGGEVDGIESSVVSLFKMPFCRAPNRLCENYQSNYRSWRKAERKITTCGATRVRWPSMEQPHVERTGTTECLW